MAPLFSKVDSNKLLHDVQNEENVIYAQFGKDLFNISKLIGRKKVARFFLTHSVVTLSITYTRTVKYMQADTMLQSAFASTADSQIELMDG